MRAIPLFTAVLLSLMGSVTAAAANENNVSLTKSPGLYPIVPLAATSPTLVLAVNKHKGRKDKIENVIDYLKSYPVSKIKSGMLDSSFNYSKLPQIPLEKWLRSILDGTPLEWKRENCATYDSNVEDNDEHCVSFLVTVRTPKWRCPEVHLSFAVGTDAKVYFLNDNSTVNDFGANGRMQQIADLKRTLEEVKAKTMPNRPSSLPAASLKAMTDQDFIKHVQALDVHSLDPSLPSERFDKWLERSARYPLQWWQASALKDYSARCEPKRLVIRVYPAYTIDPENRRPPADIMVDIGSWERGIEGDPKLAIYYKEPGDSGHSATTVKNLSALQKKFDEWNASLMTRKLIMPIPAKAPVVKNMTPLGTFSRMRATPTWHCYGHILSLWKYGGRVFGTHHDIGGQCADSREPTYVIRDVKFDSKTGKFEFWTYGTPGNKFVGKMSQDIVIGKFIDSFDEEEVKLKRNKDDGKPLPDSDINIEAWCKEYAPTIRYIVKNELEYLCKSLGVK